MLKAMLPAKKGFLPLKAPTSSGGLDLEYVNSHCESCETRRFRRTCVYMSGVQLTPPGSRGPSSKLLFLG